MGQTLTYGVYLPDEGERNCYSGLANNWQILDDAVGAIAGKANASHTHGNITNAGAIGSTSGLPVITGTDGVLTTGTFGNTAGTFCEGNDSRLSDARTPVAHTHTKSDITNLFNSANVWTGANTFQGGGIQLKDTSAVSAGGYGSAVYFYDYQGNRYGYIQPYVTSDNYKNIIIGADGTGRIQLNSNLVPYAANSVNLGTSDLQWKSVYSRAINGVNPGALGLPDTLGTSGTVNVNYFNVIGYLNNTGAIGTIPATATYDGWLYINAKDGADSYILIDDSPAGFGTSVYGNNGLGAQGIGLLCLICPIRKGHYYNIRIKSAGIVSARIYPAQGNV